MLYEMTVLNIPLTRRTDSQAPVQGISPLNDND